MCLNDQWQTIQKQRLQVTHLDCCLCCSLCSAWVWVWLDCVILILDMHIGPSRRSEWDAEIKLSGHGYKSHTDINRPPPPLPVHTVACISSALTCNCKVGKHMRHKQLSSQSADRWPTGPKFVYTILYEYCMYGFTNILCFCGLCQFMTQNNVVKAERHWTLLKARIRLTPRREAAKSSSFCQICWFTKWKRKNRKVLSWYIFFLKFKVICILNYCLFQNSDILIVIYFLVLVKCLRLCVCV